MNARRLRIPSAIAFTIVASTAAIGGLMSACEGSPEPPPDALADGNTDSNLCEIFCIPDSTSDAGVCPDPPPCADSDGNCPAGCTPVG